MKLTAGVDLGGTKVQSAVVDPEGRVLAKGRTKTPTSGGAAAVVGAISDAVGEATSRAGVEIKDLLGVGLGSPGAVDPTTGVVRGASNLPGFGEPVPLGPLVAKALGVKHVAVGNDVGMGTLGEHRFGAGKGFDDLLAVWIGTGVGGGLVLGGKPFHGTHGAAGEIGHTVVVEDGDVCGCGRRGCLEAYAGRGSIERKARAAAQLGRRTVLFDLQERAGRPRVTSGVIAQALEAGDALTHELIDRAVAALGTGVASAVNLLDVGAVLLGGGLGDKLGKSFVERVREAMIPHLFLTGSVQVVGSALGDLGGAVGASLLARETA